ETLESDRLILRKGLHWYGNVRTDLLIVEARKPTYRCFALALLGRLFHPGPPEIHVRLRHAASDIREIVLDFAQAGDGLTWVQGYETRPVRFTYVAAPLAAYPLAGSRAPESTFPRVDLTNLQNMVTTDAEWLAR